MPTTNSRTAVPTRNRATPKATAMTAPIIHTKCCERCGARFSGSPHQRSWKKRRFCSARCREYNAHERWCARERDATGAVDCESCDKPLEKTQLRFCSLGCSNAHNRGGEQPDDKTHAMTYAEIAGQLGISADRVREIEASGLRKLRHNLDAKRLMREFCQ